MLFKNKNDDYADDYYDDDYYDDDGDDDDDDYDEFINSIHIQQKKIAKTGKTCFT